jgi:hypothetical protein
VIVVRRGDDDSVYLARLHHLLGVREVLDAITQCLARRFERRLKSVGDSGQAGVGHFALGQVLGVTAPHAAKSNQANANRFHISPQKFQSIINHNRAQTPQVLGKYWRVA